MATVRDYALNIIEDASKNFVYDKIKVNPLSDSQIREILESDDFKITNRAFSDVIVRVAQGNPRLAIMAAKVALEKQDLSAFNEIPKIYDSYYDEVVKEVDKLGDITFLKVLGIISFFKTIGKGYRNNEEIFSVFGITENELWEKVITLHQMELVDLFDNEIVKISDQILATYFFYKTFIRDGILNFSILITNFYENQQKRFRDVVYPATNTFGFDHIKEKISGSLDQAWAYFEDDEPLLLKFLSLFWIFNQEKVLAHIGHQVANMPQDPTENYVFEKNKNDFAWDTDGKDYFGVLKQFLKYPYPSDNFTFALDLTFSYLEKQPSYIAEFVQHARGELSFDKDDYQFGFFRQQTLFDKLYAAISNGRTPNLFRGIFYHIVDTFLKIAFQKSGGLGRNNSFTMYTFPIPDIPPIEDFRKRIWNFLFAEFDNHRRNVIEVIWSYTTKLNTWDTREVNNKKSFWKQDSILLLSFIDESFDTQSYKECKTAQGYFEELERLDIPFNESLKDKFRNQKFELSLKLNRDLINGRDKYDLSDDPKFKKENGQTDWRAVDNQKYEELEEYVLEYKFEDYKKLWHDVNELWGEEKDRDEWSIRTSFFQILRILAIKDVRTFLELLEYIFNGIGLPENFSSSYCNNLTANALKSLKGNHHQFFNIITKYNGKGFLHWKFAFFRQIDGKYVNAYYTKELLKCLKQIEGYWSFFDFDFLNNYHFAPSAIEVIKGWLSKKVKNANRNIYTKVVSILLEKVQTEKAKISFGRNFISKYSEKLSSDFESLKMIYFSNYTSEYHFDHEGKEMKTICELQPNFLIDFMNEFYGSEYSRIGKGLLIHNFKFVWDFDNHTEVIDGLMEFAKEKKMVLMDWEHFANKFFVANDQEQIDKRLHYIKSYIERNAENKEAIQLIFNVITYSFSDKRLEYLKQFLEINQDTTIFEALSFHTNGVYSGSRIPIIEARVEFMNQVEQILKTMPNSSAFIKHRAIVKNKIEYLKRDIAWEKKREFEDYFR